MSKLSLGWLALLAIFTLTFSGCDDDDDPILNEVRTLAEIVGNDDRFSILEEQLIRTGLDVTLDGEAASFTVFAPTNDAFDALNAAGTNVDDLDTEDLRQILLYHVLPGTVEADDITENASNYYQTSSTAAPNEEQLSLLVERSGNSVTVNGDVDVVTADIDGTNGVIHAIDEVLMLPTVVDHAANNDIFSMLVDALDATGLVSTLGNPDGTFTVFAPTNSAFEAIQETVDGLTTEQLTTVLTYHVISGANVQADEVTDGEVETVSGQNLTLARSGNTVTITDASGNSVDVLLANVQGTNGVVHAIGSVLIPDLD